MPFDGVKQRTVTLPDKPSKLIRVALEDLEACERDDRYVIDMAEWHTKYSGKCHVCLAGSVMSNRLHTPVNVDSGPFAFNDELMWKLVALNEFRRGCVSEGLFRLGYYQQARDLWSVSIARYDQSQSEFKNDMRKLADGLEKAGL